MSDQELKAATEVDFEKEVALVVTVGDGATETIIGGGRYVVFGAADAERKAEVAFTVEEDYQGQGIAGMPLRHLVSIARQKGVSQFEAEVLPGKQRDAHRLLTQRAPHADAAWRRRRACDAVADGGQALILAG